MLRLDVCASAGDGKSALIARLLEDSRARFGARLGALAAEAKRAGTRLGALDFGLMSHGPSARIDIADHCFCTERRNIVVADTPGDAPYARNQVAGTSTAELAVIVVDARKGVAPQSRRHAFLVSLLGIRHVLVAVNKMDLAGHSQAAFAAIDNELRAFATQLGLPAVTCVPVSAVAGDNVVRRAAAMPWYRGPTLVDLLDSVEVDEARLREQPLRLPVDRHGTGTIVAGRLRTGDAVRLQPAGRVSRVARIVAAGSTRDEAVDEATVGQSITVTLEDQLDAANAELMVPANEPAEVADQFEATVVWMHETPMLPGRSYLLAIGAATVNATIVPLKYKINPDNLQRLAAVTLQPNEVGVCNLQLDRPVAFDSHRVNRGTGGFVLTDRGSNDVAGAGMLHFALRRAHNVHWQALDVNKTARAAIKGQRACVLWYTGLSAAGKSTIANLVDKKLHSLNRHTYLLDGDNVRHGLNKDLGFTDADRVENIRRITEVAKLMVDAGLIVSTAFISPFRTERQTARALLPQGEFIEVFVDTPLGVAEQRDPKGLYKKARRGDLKNFTGIDSPYEPPENPELRIDTTITSPEEAAQMIVGYLQQRGMLDPG